ncbi:MAG: plastocyanin/azurin family copper-binding protein [Nitrospinota bacterium]
MKEVRVALNEYSIVQPQADSPFLVLKVGQPYKLNISNVGRKVHVFSASSFFRKIALLKIGFGKNTEIESSRVNNIMIGAGKTVSLYFVPLEKGTYKVVCALPLHLNAGMQSQIVVQGG